MDADLIDILCVNLPQTMKLGTLNKVWGPDKDPKSKKRSLEVAGP